MPLIFYVWEHSKYHYVYQNGNISMKKRFSLTTFLYWGDELYKVQSNNTVSSGDIGLGGSPIQIVVLSIWTPALGSVFFHFVIYELPSKWTSNKTNYNIMCVCKEKQLITRTEIKFDMFEIVDGRHYKSNEVQNFQIIHIERFHHSLA